MKPLVLLTLFVLLGLHSACKSRNASETQPSAAAADDSTNTSFALAPETLNPCSFVLVPHAGGAPVDREIVKLQQAIGAGGNVTDNLERLGWLYVAKARSSFDNGYYKLAEQCALCLETHTTNDARALLLLGHALHNLHRFKEAEPVARGLVTSRGEPSDFGLLGDILMEQGRLKEAIDSYQKMMDLRPDSRANARAAHVRWLKGDLAGAIEAMTDAVNAVGSRDKDSAAWMQTRLAFYTFQAGDLARSQRSCEAALRLETNYAPALLLKGRMLLSEDKTDAALDQFRHAAGLNPLPEYYWAWSEAATQAGLTNEAQEAVAMLRKRGASDDPRTFALYLATAHESPELAARLAEEELQQRADVFTQDAVAWTQFVAGNLAKAQAAMAKAVAEGTTDARLFLHSAVIQAAAGDKSSAETFLQKTYALKHLLWPSERNLLESTMAALAWKPAPTKAESAKN